MRSLAIIEREPNTLHRFRGTIQNDLGTLEAAEGNQTAVNILFWVDEQEADHYCPDEGVAADILKAKEEYMFWIEL